MAFDITSVLRGVSGPDTEQIEYLPLDSLLPDPNNFYSLEGLDELAGNIETIGLQQPLRVRPGEDPGTYIIVSGHRRRAAIMLIRDGGSDMFDRGVPCIVERGEASEALQKLRLIYANSATRAMTSADLSKQAEEVEMLLYQLKEEGMEFPGRMRDHVAEACKVSKTKLARLHAIRKNLDPGFLTYFDRGDLTEESAYQLSRLPWNIQREAAIRVASGNQKKLPTAYVVEKVNKYLKQYLQELPCRSHAGGPDCHHKDEKILRSIFAPHEWQVCPYDQCCRDCYHAKTCSRACQECKDRWKLEKDVEKEKEEEHEKARQREQERRKAIYRKSCRRLIPLIDAAGLEDDDELPGNFSWNAGQKVSKIRKWASGDFGESYLNDDDGIIPSGTRALASWAEKLGCSTDYLLGRTPSVQSDPSALSWLTGTPTECGDYTVRSGIPDEEGPKTSTYRIIHWNGEGWSWIGTGVPFADNVYRWVKLPEI